MERLISETRRSLDDEESDDAYIRLSDDAEFYVENDGHPTIPEKLLRLDELDVAYDPDGETL